MKKVIVLSLAILLMLTLVGCGEDTPEDEDYLVTITYWNIFTGPDGEEMVGMVNDFNELHEGEFRVNTQTVPAGDFYEKLNTVVPQGQGPDVAIMHLDYVAKYADLGMLVSFDDLMADSQINGEDYIPAVWDAGEFDGSRYAIPLDVHPIGLYYNQDILDEYDVEVPTTYDELVSACDILTDEANDQWCLPISNVWPSGHLFTSALFQNGGKGLDENGEYPGFNTSGGYNALKVFQDLIYTHEVSPENVTVDEDLALFRQGKAAFHINGIWMVNGVAESDINFGTAPIATLFGDTPATWAGSHNFVMPRPAKINADKQEAIMEFVKYITENSIRWAGAGQIPANITVLESDEFDALPYVSTFADVSSLVFIRQSPYFEDAYTPIYSRVTEAMTSGMIDIQTLLDEAEQEGIQRANAALGR